MGARFNWMRRRILAVVGGSFYYEVPAIVHLGGEPVIWFNRDERERLLINVRMLTTSGEPRMLIEDNFWLTEGSGEHDIECPPSASWLRRPIRTATA